MQALRNRHPIGQQLQLGMADNLRNNVYMLADQSPNNISKICQIHTLSLYAHHRAQSSASVMLPMGRVRTYHQ
jgi:hypothetical protein